MAMEVFDDFFRLPERFGLRIVGSVAAHDAVRDDSDLDLQVVGDQIVLPRRLRDVFAEVPGDVSWLYESGQIDVVALKAILDGIAISIQFLNSRALATLARPQGSCLHVYRTTATNPVADFRGFSDEVMRAMPQIPYRAGFMLLVPDGAAFDGTFRLNLYQRMLLAGRNVRSTPELAGCRTTLASTVRDVGRSAYSLRDPVEFVWIFGPRTAGWNGRFVNQVAELFQ
jgi:hypothetical protein